MKRNAAIALFALIAAAAPFAPAVDGTSPYWFAGEDATVFPLVSREFQETWLQDRLTIGLGVRYNCLTSKSRPEDTTRTKTFIGYVNRLEDEDEFGLVLPEIRYWAADYVRATLSFADVSARTRNFNATRHSDGVANAWGPEFLVEGLWPLCEDTVFLHAGAGVTYAFCDFSEDLWWNLGYSTRQDWIDHGSPPVKTAANHYREIHVDDAFGYALCAGVSWRPAPRLELDLSLRHTWLEPDCTFGYNYGSKHGGYKKQMDGELTLDHLAVVLSCSYVF